MSIEKLKKLEEEVGTLSNLQRRDERASRKLQEVRTNKTGWKETWDAMTGHYNGRNERALEVLNSVLDEVCHDILRIAELRLAASEREYKVKAAQRSAVLNACILPLPEETNHDN